jgi:hypothetical protein
MLQELLAMPDMLMDSADAVHVKADGHSRRVGRRDLAWAKNADPRNVSPCGAFLGTRRPAAIQILSQEGNTP